MSMQIPEQQAAPTMGLRLIKRFDYRGDPNEEFSNQYWFTGPTPTSTTEWRNLFNMLVAEEKKVYSSAVQVIKGYGYDSTADGADSVWTVDLRVAPDVVVPGTLNATGLRPAAGDAAVWTRWGLDRLANGKRVYLRKYFHCAYSDSAGSADLVAAVQRNALIALGAALAGETALPNRHITDKLGTPLLNWGASTYITTRTLKRRGKRPPT